MAFNTLEKAQIRSFLGYPQRFRQLNPRLESAMDGLETEMETMIRAEIVQILAIDAAIAGTTRTVAGIAQADDARFFNRSDGNRFDSQRKEGRMRIGRISKMLGAPINFGCDYFAIDGYQGDRWSGEMGDNYGAQKLRLG
jgi:hypothetical protein